ncbi:Hypp3482 [Branchiostoma lanceolatum]|uniref:Hypp3482 protein n=1 Tax=Branchiostoma lanceolatum TaxID=7740 RepID=A0A8K0A239_BRALA|nr:Hypp3482 [Branchiostoma lanceolatum]
MPGDLHASGYMEECFAKSQGPGGLYHITTNVLQRKKVKQETYGKDKFKENNLQLIREANRDVGYGYGLCAVVEFRDSDSFPSDEELLNCGTDKGPLLLSRFKEWLKKCSEDDVDFGYRAQSVTLFGPLTRLLYSSIKNGDGAARETVWMLLLPIFSQSKRKNYWIEALAHTVNVTAAWPIAIKMMVRQNCSVSVDGRKGHNIACDEFVETHMVKPL